MDGPVVTVTVLACYDISDDRRRAKVAPRLQRWVDRLQYSVFLCTIIDDDLDTPVAAITEIIRPDTDSFYLAPPAGTLSLPSAKPGHRPRNCTGPPSSDGRVERTAPRTGQCANTASQPLLCTRSDLRKRAENCGWPGCLKPS